MSGPAFALAVAAAIIVALVWLLDRALRSREPETWADVRARQERERAARQEALELGTFLPLAWRVVRGGVVVPSTHPGDVAGKRVVGGEVVSSWGWRDDYNDWKLGDEVGRRIGPPRSPQWQKHVH